ncbi:hypothetical protein [Flavilitoribacter nigricans]|uniref:Uncharacterized protein n=1 Tax=Flavilitoribacter nigricans (strain ATCC 23147 / DSM 23189 / NBRC 102662 / NCIMB 1420 / SS-2) TaxID=1122177 RepID=A0A2D0N4B9_FLAN2|nr:hypothetical protein [Flavilitoribacter nigricans]PHN02613.1 hypothetical protein CRP01_30940 [Flavilitoribacter nigricans DSM 23189 = NBRC 102662]
MQDSKIIGLLKNLEPKEFRLLHKYLRSPFFNYSPSLVALYEYIRKYYPDFDHPAVDRRKAFSRLFPEETYNDKKMRNLLHEFFGHLENFLVQLHVRDEPLTRKKLLVESLEKRGSYETFAGKNRELIREISDRPYRDVNTYWELLNLEEQYYFHPATDKVKNGEESLVAILENMDHYFMANKLRLANEVQARRKVVRQKIPMQFVDEVLKVSGADRGANSVIHFHALLYHLNETEAEEQFYALKKMFLESMEALGFNDRQVILFQLLNYAIRNGNQGKTDLLREAFDLYWFGLQHKLLFENGKLTDSSYTNIVFLGGKFGLLDKVERFIKEHSQDLDEKVRSDAENLAMANLLFLKKAYTRIDDLIGNARFDSIFYQLRAKLILLRALYESFVTDDSFFDLLQARIDAFDKFLRRNTQLSGIQRESYLAFIRQLKAVVKVNMMPSNQAEREDLKNKILQIELIPNKEWLLEKLNA